MMSLRDISRIFNISGCRYYGSFNRLDNKNVLNRIFEKKLNAVSQRCSYVMFNNLPSIQSPNKISRRNFQTTGSCSEEEDVGSKPNKKNKQYHFHLFMDVDRYIKEKQSRMEINEKFRKKPMLERLSINYNYIVKQFKQLAQEQYEVMTEDTIYFYDHGHIEIIHKFDTAKDLEKYEVLCDSSDESGFSHATLTSTLQGAGLFQGYTSQKLPMDGYTKKAGWCCLRTKKRYRPFHFPATESWTCFNHLVLKLRGDGRTYKVIVGIRQEFDTLHYSTFQYPLYTRGGPYWQIAKIPFSKFVFTNRARIQDCFHHFQPSAGNVSYLGLLAADSIDGPFKLEVDYIGLMFDQYHKEKSAYELYKHERHTVQC